MFFNLLVFLLIVLITLYLATQGLLSSLLALTTAIFSSILAMALLELAQAPLAGFKPDYARGATFLLLFLLTFSATRISADLVVPKTIKLSLWVNRIGGGVVGFFVALVVVGTTVLGLEMLPLPRTIMYFDRYPGENVMAGQEPGVAAKPAGLLFGPDRFVLAIWNGASGRSLGGSKPWASVHEDLSAESYGYRSMVAAGSARTLVPDLLEVKAGWWSDDAAEVKAARDIPAAEGKRVVMVRVSITKGDKAPKSSADQDAHFRLSASQVRLITSGQNQYYPAGYLGRAINASTKLPEKPGTKFHALPLDSGVLVEDYPQGTQPVLIDLVFLIDPREEPRAIEMKQLARKELTGLQKGVLDPAPMAAYPPRDYAKNQGSLTVQFDAGDKNIIAAKVYLMQTAVIRKDIDSQLNGAESKLIEISGHMSSGTGGWTAGATTPGLPSTGQINFAKGQLPNLKGGDRDSAIQWEALLPVLMLGQMSADPQLNLTAAPRYVNETLLPIWKSQGASGILLKAEKEMTPDKQAVIGPIIGGEYFVVATLQTEKGFFMWYWTFKVEPGKLHEQRRLSSTGTSNAGFSVNLEAPQ